MERGTVVESQFERYRPYLFSIAYRMLGSVMEAEDMVQETYLRYEAHAPEGLDSPQAYLSTIITRLCLDHLKSARVQRESYIGPWLPEPLLTDASTQANPLDQVGQLESISTAFLVLLESLSPLERAVFLLREVFAYDYSEIARIVEREEATCRQLFSRAKKHLTSQRPRFEAAPETHERLLSEFMQVLETGDTDPMLALLVEDVTWTSDGGGRVSAATRPLVGREPVMQLIERLLSMRPPDFGAKIAEVNGLPALIFNIGDQVFGVVTIETDGQQITAIRFVLNPDKLAHLQTPGL